LLIAIILAIQFPNVARKGGYIRAEWTIKWGKLQELIDCYSSLIFFFF
jgi:hypothetical protein